MDLDNQTKVCEECNEKKTLRNLFRCAECARILCDEHACEEGYALCNECEE